jgi:hypothetical protein
VQNIWKILLVFSKHMQKLFTIAVIMLGISGAGVFHTVSAQEVRTVQFFSDLQKDSLVGQAAANLREAGVIQGYGDGTFQPEKPVNRAELAKFLLLAKGRNVDIKLNNGRFPDVKEGEWYVRYVIDAADLGILSGYPGGNFKPDQTVNTAEFLKMLSKTFSLPENLPQDFADVKSEDWFAPYAGNVPELDLFPDRDPSFLEPARDMTRGEVAVALYHVIRPKLEEEENESSTASHTLSVTRTISGLSVRSENENAQLSMTYAGKKKELVLPLIISLMSGEATIKSFQIEFSSAKFLDEVWFDGGIKKSADRLRVTLPIDKKIIAGTSNEIDLFASVQKGLKRGDEVKVFLKKIEWEKNGNTYTHDFPINGFELMIF